MHFNYNVIPFWGLFTGVGYLVHGVTGAVVGLTVGFALSAAAIYFDL